MTTHKVHHKVTVPPQTAGAGLVQPATAASPVSPPAQVSASAAQSQAAAAQVNAAQAQAQAQSTSQSANPTSTTQPQAQSTPAGTASSTAAAQQTQTSATPSSATQASATPGSATQGATGTGVGAAGTSGTTTTGSTDSTSSSSGSSSQQQGMDATQAMAALKQQFGTDYEDPIVAANGNVYMEQRQPDLDSSGKLVLRYIHVGTVSSDGKTFYPDENFIQQQESKLDPNGKLVQVNNQYYWQSTQDDGQGDGGLTANLTPLSDSQVQQLQQAQSQQDQQTALQTFNQNSVDWMQKLGSVSGWMKTVGFTGSFVQGMMAGPDPVTGASSAHWLTGYMILQMLDGQAGGKLLPQQLKQGWLGNALNYAIQGMFFLQTPDNLKVLGQAFPRTAAVMRAFTAPTRAVINGVKHLIAPVETAASSTAAAAAGEAADAAGTASQEATEAAGAADAATQGAADAEQAVPEGTAGAEGAAAGADEAAAADAQAAASAADAAAATEGIHPNIAAHVGAGPTMGVGREALSGGAAAGAAMGPGVENFDAEVSSVVDALNKGVIKGVVGGTGLQNAVAVVTDESGTAQIIDKSVFQAAMKQIAPAVQGADKIQGGIDGVMNGLLKRMAPLLGPLKVGGGVLGAIAGALNVGLEVKNYGASSLVTDKDGRGAMFGLLGSVAFLGMLALPSIAMEAETMSVVANALNLATNVFYGISMVNQDGLFGGGGWLDHDAVRAAFLIPPLTPIGLVALVLKHRENKKQAQAQALQQAQQQAVSTIQNQRSQNQSQLQQSGSIQGGTVQSDGSISVPTGVSNDLSSAGSANGPSVPSALGHMMSMIGRPIEYHGH